DEFGLCVWQDFMFACSAYPAHDAAFLANVRQEASDNVRRLRHHACLALWCGNNELEECGFATDDGANGRMTWAEYDRLFNELLPSVVSALDPDRTYWPCSGHNPMDRRKPKFEGAGDSHLWQVWHGRQPFEWYRTSFHRFCSEFGFQSFPEPRTVNGFTVEADRNITSPVMEHHQRSGIGNTVIVQYLLSWFRMPNGFENTLWLSQIQQALAMKYAVEHWRIHRPRCMGALYWQLNDCWPAISWAGMDYGGGYKTLQYFAKRFFNPVAIFAAPKGGAVSVNVINDRSEPLKGKLRYTVYDFSGKVLSFGENAGEIPEKSSAHFLDISPKKLGINPKNSVLKVEFIDNKGAVLACESSLFLKDRSVKLPDAPIEITKKIEGGRLIVTLKSEVFSRRVFVDAKGMTSKFSQNYFDLFPGETKTVFLELEENAEDLSVSALSLNMLKPQKSRAAEFLIKAKAVLEPMNFINMIGQLFN
ncbi:MAG TPA: glycoside hydrolase family 2 protein, partial [Clostridia bacterium]|nr:glycoside hydrolase family 2 protein [Clostridia bacterium]